MSARFFLLLQGNSTEHKILCN